ncbi:MAG TPA: MerR family transcriptional regulator [Chitinophagaceae bacterium]|nr:MerR family transcriptional regulator [Chitinophagaceae bacterium]
MNKELFGELMAKKFTVKDLTELDSKITYRTINHWDEKGYLLAQKDEEGWRKFSFADYVWILLLDELREFDIAVKNIISTLFIDFGFPYDIMDEMSDEEIDELRKMPFEKLIKQIDRDYALESFCRILVTIISYKTPLTLRFFKDGTSLAIYGNPAYHGIKLKPLLDVYNKALLESNFQSSISISIDSLIKDFVDKKSLTNISELMLLSKKEINVLDLLNNGELQEVTIFYKDGKPNKIELTDKIMLADSAKRVKEHFLTPYERCEFIKNGGDKHFFKRTISKNLNN